MNSWIATSAELPQEGDTVLFVVERRCIVLCGIYAECTFKSRWSRYHPGEVSEWCRLDADAAERVYHETARRKSAHIGARAA
ncbi:hypothetical protein [Dokdonella sp.]|uniref:hypothetical protein n=1 Tax=Dokdonella sp. TaxID=2291710 RepID=UPI001B220748|nr:hypothetical protein [Dokdonella sp.]MBO9662857.1 hypothetical protein [Dokdonella sp.]